jgi:hypothetical protein
MRSPEPGHRPPRRVARCTADVGRYDAATILIIVVALLCVAMLALFGVLWAALHFGVGHDDDD